MTAPEVTLDDLTRVLRECAGEDERVDLGGNILDVPFTDLGYDSVALLEAVARVERERGIELDDEAVGGARTPRLFLALINNSPAPAA
ncbi:acyl carrier protein [Streptomyces albireticuli]|uniref:acyl carrier protein n=1 Tax=Streptomyces albireticuli TaxID=1940 RepID=UPI00369CDA70